MVIVRGQPRERSFHPEATVDPSRQCRALTHPLKLFCSTPHVCVCVCVCVGGGGGGYVCVLLVRVNHSVLSSVPTTDPRTGVFLWELDVPADLSLSVGGVTTIGHLHE